MSACKWLIVTVVLIGSLCSFGCDQLECGDGTLEENGECILPGDPPGAECDEGQQFNPLTLICEDIPEVECDPSTTKAVENEDGTITCVGTGGGSSSCDVEISCPEPSSTKVSICGQIYAVHQSGVKVRAAEPTGEACTEKTADGPCSLELLLFDPLRFATNPTGTDPLSVEQVIVDDCGRFSVLDAPIPSSGVLAIALDDWKEGSISDDLWAQTGAGLVPSRGEQMRDLEAAIVPNSAVEAWTTSAGDPFGGQTFSEKGVFYAYFTYPGTTPRSGVKVTGAAGVSPEDDYYFVTPTADDFPAELTPPDDLTTARIKVGDADETTEVGAGLIVNSSLGTHSGNGSLPAECEWEAQAGAAVQGVVFWAPRYAHIESTPDDVRPAE